MMSSDPRVPPILPHPHSHSSSGHAGVHGHGHGGNVGNGNADAGGSAQQQQTQKPRAPKSYTEPQMAFLRSHLEEFEKRSQGPVRGDAKKYALEQAGKFITNFGLPTEFHTLEEGDSRFKEQIYNWFKNTIGRKRRQAEGKPRSVKTASSNGNSKNGVKASDRSVSNSNSSPAAGPSTLSPTLQWNNITASVQGQAQAQAQSQLPPSQPQQQAHPTTLASYAHGQHVAESSSSSPALGTTQPQAISLGPIHYGGLHTPQQTPQHIHSNTPPIPNSTTAGPSHTTHHSNHSTHSAHSNSSHHSAPPNNHHQTLQLPMPASTPIPMHQSQMTHTQVNQETLRDAFLSPTVDASTLASMIQNYVASSPLSLTPLTAVVEVLYSASICGPPSAHKDSSGRGHGYSREPNSGYSRDPTVLVQKFYDASRYWGNAVAHCGVSGSEAAGRALMGLVRKHSVWQPLLFPSSSSSIGFNSASTNNSGGLGMALGGSTLGLQQGGVGLQGLGMVYGGGSKMNGGSLSEDMQRIMIERQRRKDHIQWARIHAAALEVGLVGSAVLQLQGDSSQAYAQYVAARAFSEIVARDAVWEGDEAEWVAGLFVLRGLIRSASQGGQQGGHRIVDRRQVDEYREMLQAYESRWKEIKDEVRQSVATEVLVSAKDELVGLDEALGS